MTPRIILIWTDVFTGREVARDVFAAHPRERVAAYQLTRMRANPQLDCRFVEEPHHG
ncbi:hypothetical protein [Falsiroseomonas sp.]|uniref:hypothetical protein n=1 Tax=Falsiroseomonas sp. TaxID=2870721 RepID=UPI002734FEEB|nr:hypothetical protein [Falsiroseomonas sp.]MDP3417886.1 hypothetical protein [Falsiroseomonas sp.]